MAFRKVLSAAAQPARAEKQSRGDQQAGDPGFGNDLCAHEVIEAFEFHRADLRISPRFAGIARLLLGGYGDTEMGFGAVARAFPRLIEHFKQEIRHVQIGEPLEDAFIGFRSEIVIALVVHVEAVE